MNILIFLCISSLSHLGVSAEPDIVPLKIHVEYLDDHATSRTRRIIREAVACVSNLLSLQNEDRQQVFHVPRKETACQYYYYDGPNTGKCAKLSRNYDGEFCGQARVPETHLEGLAVYGYNGSHLPDSLPEGRGFLDGTKFVLYLTSRKDQMCHHFHARSKVCRSDASMVGGVPRKRPVAGAINLCWVDAELSEVVTRRVIVHELLHLLAVNYGSIREFLECESKRDAERLCWKLRNVIRVNQSGEVVVWSRHLKKATRQQRNKKNEMSSHCEFNFGDSLCPPWSKAMHSCNGVNFTNLRRSVERLSGIALATSRTGVHWPQEFFDDPVSVMIPGDLENGSVIIDILTLALIKTSGWYYINHHLLPCINCFLNSCSSSEKCYDYQAKKTYSMPQQEEFGSSEDVIQNTTASLSPHKFSGDYEENNSSEENRGLAPQSNTVAPNNLNIIKFHDSSSGSLPSGCWLGQLGRRSLVSSSPPAMTSPQAAETSQEEPESDYGSEMMKKVLKYPDYFKIAELFTIEDLFNARVHLGHTEGSLDDHMRQFVFGSRLGNLIIDLDQTAVLLRDALNVTAHIAFRGGIILFVGRSPQHQLLIENTAKECGEYAHTRFWQGGVLTNSTIQFGCVTRLPDLIILLHTKNNAIYEHIAIRDGAKMLIPTVAIVDTNCNPNLVTYPVPGNDDTTSSVGLFCNLFKKAIIRGKEKRKELLDL